MPQAAPSVIEHHVPRQCSQFGGQDFVQSCQLSGHEAESLLLNRRPLHSQEGAKGWRQEPNSEEAMDWPEEEAQGFGKEPEFHEIEKVGPDLVVGRQLFDLLTPILVESAAICGPGLRIDLEGRGESGAHCEERVSKFVTDVAVKPRHCLIETLVHAHGDPEL